ncbi:hypothetical protein QOT17_020969 [Balamuthia mandrillaris]
MWRSATGHEVKPKGYVTLRFQMPTYKNVKATIAVLAEDDPMLHDLLIGWDILEETQDVVDIIYPVELPIEEEVMMGLRELMNDANLDIGQKAWLLELALEYKDVFCYKLPEPGSVKLPPHKIVLTDYTPICVKPEGFLPNA